MGGPLIPLLALLATPSAACELDAPPDAAFAVSSVDASRVRAMLELWVADGAVAWASGLLDVVEARGLHATVVVPLPDEARIEGLDALLVRAVEGEHEVAVWLNAARVPKDVLAPPRELRRSLKPLKKQVGPVRAVVAPIGSQASEALLGRAGFRSLLNSSGSATAEARLAGHFEGQPRIDVVMNGGPYDGPCGHQPRLGPFTPLTADRIGTMLQRANAAPGVPIVRVALDGHRAGDDDAAVLARWLDEVAVPSGVSFVTPNEARLAALRRIRTGTVDVPPPDPSAAGRVVSVEEAVAAAESLREVRVVPRTLPGDLTPSEAFYAFLLVVAERQEEGVVRLGALQGPPMLAESTLEGETPVERDALSELAEALLGGMPTEVPAALPVGGELLTASELLLALASAVRGDEQPTARPVGVIDPNARGLGWGEATLP